MKKIDTEKSLIYRFNRLSDLTKCVLFLGEKGYFSDYKNFFGYTYGTLTEVTVGYTAKNLCPFKRYGDESDTGVYSYFIPESKVVFEEEPKEKKYRPYKDVSEFSNETGCEVLGEDFITIRNKNTQKVYVLLYIGYSEDTVYLGGFVLSFEDLYNNFEYENIANDGWQSFGVEDEED